MPEKECVTCKQRPALKGLRFCSSCKREVEKQMDESNYLTPTIFPKTRKQRSARHAEERAR
jgi:hypothetical protein